MKDQRGCIQEKIVFLEFLDIDLERMDDVDLSFGEEKKRSFSFYRFDDEESYTTIHLVSNRSTNGYLIPELKQMDYFLQYWGCHHQYKIFHI